MLRIWMRRVIRRQGVVRPLAHHVVSTRIAIWGLPHGGRAGLVPRVREVRRRNLRTPLLRSITVVVAIRGLRHRWHAITRYERLCLWVEGMAVEASRYRVLALWIIGINVDWKSAVSVRYAWCARWCGSSLVRALIKAGRWRWRWRLLPIGLRWGRTLHRRHVRCRRH